MQLGVAARDSCIAAAPVFNITPSEIPPAFSSGLRQQLAAYYGGRAIKEIRLQHRNNAAMYARAACHHALERLGRPTVRKDANKFSRFEPRDGQCTCEMA